MYRWVVLTLAYAALAAAEHSPHADDIEELVRDGAGRGARHSNNILEDARLDVPGLIAKYNYPMEVHHVTTSDGYILEMHRIPHGRDNNNAPGRRPIVFMMHGLLASSADWVLMGPGTAFGYQLAEEGYDVWMGNARGNYYSRRHLSLNPNGILNTQFWEFSWDEIGNIDVPAMIDYALAHTGEQRVHYVGYSQGTTAFFVMTSLRQEYNNKIISMHALAPVAYMANNRNLLLNVISPFANQIETMSSLIGIGEFLPNNNIMTWAGERLCMDEVMLQPVCSNILFLVAGWNRDQHNTTMLPVKLGHTPAGAAVRQIAHYGQGIAGKEFRRYDYGRWILNRRMYGSATPPRYPLDRITTPVFLHYSDNDPLAHVNDVLRLHRELGRSVGLFRVPMATFSHLDFVWGIDAKTLIYDRVVNLMKSMDVHAQPVEDSLVTVYGEQYKRHVMLGDVNIPYKFAIDREKNNLFFCINSDEFSSQSFLSVLLNLDSGVTSIIPGIRNGFASAVDQDSGEVYLGGSDGVFKFNYSSGDVEQPPLVTGMDIFDMYFSKDLYFVNTASQDLYRLRNNKVSPVNEVKGYLIHHFVIDSHDDLFFVNPDGLFILPRGVRAPVFLEGTYMNISGATTDKTGVVHFIAQDGIYTIDVKSKHLIKILPVENGHGLAFDKDNNIIYSDNRSVYKLHKLGT